MIIEFSGYSRKTLSVNKSFKGLLREMSDVDEDMDAGEDMEI